MPPRTDVTIDPPKLYYSDGDGNYVPFTGIQQTVIIEEAKYNSETFEPIWTEAGELTFTLTEKSNRHIRKMFNRIMNSIHRNKRRAKRRKEKARRTRLKYGEVHI